MPVSAICEYYLTETDDPEERKLPLKFETYSTRPPTNSAYRYCWKRSGDGFLLIRKYEGKMYNPLFNYRTGMKLSPHLWRPWDPVDAVPHKSQLPNLRFKKVLLENGMYSNPILCDGHPWTNAPGELKEDK